MDYKLIPVKNLRALEYVFPNHLQNLSKMILKDGMIKQPLVIDKDYKIVLDGSHKHVFLAMNGYKYAPVYEVDYHNQHIRVGSHRKHSINIENYYESLSKEEVIRRGLTGDLFKPRTTRHIFPFKRPDINIPLEKLGKTKPLDMSKNIANVTIDEEINHNKHYIKEIDEEILAMNSQIKDIKLIRKYLIYQIRSMECKQ